MGEQEVVELLENKGRLSSREIATLLDWSITKTCDTIRRMLNKDIVEVLPTESDLKRLLENHPRSIHGLNRLRFFTLK